jgi:hypothetical protein
MRASRVGIVAGGITVAAGVVAAVGALAWDRTTGREVARLVRRDGAVRRDGGRYDPSEIAALPAPVARYFALVLTPGQPLVARARLEQRGTFATAPGKWAPFTAVEHFSVSPPGFLWDARIRMAPLVTTRVRDSYVGGAGSMRAAVAGFVTVADQRGTPEMASSSLLRYFAESAWLPTALLPSAGVRWAAIDDSTARATLGDGPTTVTMDVHFGPAGEIARVTALRHRDVKGAPVLTPWEGRFTDYVRMNGMLVPGSGEVGWIVDGAWTPYWRGRTLRAEYSTP